MTLLPEKKISRIWLILFVLIVLIVLLEFWIGGATAAAAAEKEDEASDLQHKMQDPLADLSALNIENTITFGLPGEPAYIFQLQPIYSFEFPKFNLIAQGIVPILGVAPLADLSRLENNRGTGNRVWGLSDVVTQFMVSPKSKGNWKWGVGPMISWRTRSDEQLAGAGWGAGPTAVVVGAMGPFSIVGLASNLWAFDGNVNTMTIQPNVIYNFESFPGLAVSYTGAINADWKATSDNRWTVPLGGEVSKFFDLGGGWALNASIGAYGMIVRPDNGPDWQMKLGFFFLIPR